MFFGVRFRKLCKPAIRACHAATNTMKGDHKLKCKREKIPVELVEKIQDQSVHLIDRILTIDEYRKEYGHPIDEIAAMLGTNPTMYKNMLTIAQSHNLGLISKVKDGSCSIKQALRLLEANAKSGAVPCSSLFRYSWIHRIERLTDVEIIHESPNNILYRTKEGLFLGIIYNGGERICRIDDLPSIVNAMTAFLQNGNIRWRSGDFALFRKGEKQHTFLRYFIVSIVTNRPCDDVKQAKVSYKSGICNGIYDLRVSNLTCFLLTRDAHPDAHGGFHVVQNCNHEIVIIDQNHGRRFITDYHKWLYDFLKTRQDKLRYQARDNRLCIKLGNDNWYLYHIVMAVHLYGTPENEEELVKKLNRQQNDYLIKSMEIDHLDADIHNNRLSNLMFMTGSQNAQKSDLQNEIRKLGLPYFCWQERYDDTSIRLMAGYVHQLHSPHYLIQGVFSIKEYLKEVDNFVTKIRSDAQTCEKFGELENQLNKEEKNENSGK